MTLLEAIQSVSAGQNAASQPTDMIVGEVLTVDPLTIQTDLFQAPLRAEVLLLTESVIEKKITALSHAHNTLHNHSVTEGSISPAGECSTALSAVACYENGQALLNPTGYIMLNRGLAVGDKVLMLAVRHGQKFIVLSRLF